MLSQYQATMTGRGVTLYEPTTLPGSNVQMKSWNTDGTFAGYVSAVSPAGSGTELQYRNGSAFGAVAGSSYANGGIALVNQLASAVPFRITGAASQSGNLFEVNSSSGSGGDRFAVSASGAITASDKISLPIGKQVVFGSVASGSIFQGFNNSLYFGGATISTTWAAVDANGFYVRSNAAFRWSTSATDPYATQLALAINAAGVIEVNNGTAGQYRDLRCRNVILTTSTPSSAGATGVQGTIAWDADFIYICTATDTWKRVAIATWP